MLRCALRSLSIVFVEPVVVFGLDVVRKLAAEEDHAAGGTFDDVPSVAHSEHLPLRPVAKRAGAHSTRGELTDGGHCWQSLLGNTEFYHAKVALGLCPCPPGGTLVMNQPLPPS